jgi:hypothetical protein
MSLANPTAPTSIRTSLASQFYALSRRLTAQPATVWTRRGLPANPTPPGFCECGGLGGRRNVPTHRMLVRTSRAVAIWTGLFNFEHHTSIRTVQPPKRETLALGIRMPHVRHVDRAPPAYKRHTCRRTVLCSPALRDTLRRTPFRVAVHTPC